MLLDEDGIIKNEFMILYYIEICYFIFFEFFQVIDVIFDDVVLLVQVRMLEYFGKRNLFYSICNVFVILYSKSFDIYKNMYKLMCKV